MNKFASAQDIKVGVVGYGGAFNMGRAHLKQMLAAGMTPVAVTEMDPDRLQVATEDFLGIETYPSLEEMLAKSSVNLIVLITPHNTHAPLALQCLNAGRHVVCEKPLAITTEEVDAMIAAATANDVMLSTYHNRHWDGRIMLARELVREQKLIGEIIRVDCFFGGYGQPRDWWRSSRSISGGVLYDWGVHLLEYSFQLIDSRMTEITGFAHNGYWAPKTQWAEDTTEDEGFLVVRFDDQTWLTLCISTLDAKGEGCWLRIRGTEGTLTLDNSHAKLYQVSDGKKITTEYPNPVDEGARYYENVRDHLVDGAELIITAEWSRRPIHVLDLATQSAQQGKTLPVKYS
ncbi:MAG: Gfo/Idh/MocA family protein [Verrucomicrobiales bacterium]